MLDTERTAAPDPEGGEGVNTDAAGSGGSTTFDQLLAEARAIEPDAPVDDEAAPAETPGVAPGTKATEPTSSEAPAPAAAPPAAPAATVAPSGTTKPEVKATPPAEPGAKQTPTPTDGPTPEPVKPFTLTVDKREVTLTGAREDGENIVIPKTTWHGEMKNYLADRAAINRREQQVRETVRQLTEERGANETVAGTMMAELDRIMELPEAESFEEWEKLKAGYASTKAKAEANYWKQRATGHLEVESRERAAEEMQQYIPALQKQVRKFAEDATTSVKGQLEGLSDAETAAFTDRLNELLIEEADEGRIFVHTGEKIPNTTLPKLDVNFQRIASIVEREVRIIRGALERNKDMRKSMAEVEAAARANAEAEARRRGVTAPPAVSSLTATGGPVGGEAAKSWDDLVAAALNE